ncbi:MAG TPA: glutamate 5-kinase [Bacillota bacterium]|jgi:glutamate 5-kinase|nr:glutamate 5-kinase [Bacillota bacterium]HOL09229.1 glutamate 5-kinase [Bacillota bacterium]HPO97053.1 glutamate 5-kinase [Bacillota bacterium]
MPTKYLKKITQAERIVVKIGTSTLTHTTGKLNISRMEQLVRRLVDLQHQGKEVVLVSSGAVGAGMGRLGINERPSSIVERQALAAIGQGLLMQVYEKLFSEYGLIVAQVLLTRSDLSDRKRYLNARNTILTLLKYNVIPIINENDTVATEELKIGENDALSALVTGLIDANLLILLSDIDGLYTADPKKDRNAKLIECVPEITPEIKQMAGGAGSSFGTGGMITKLAAAQMATASGADMVLMNGSQPQKILALFEGRSVGTVFLSKQTVVNHRKRWIAYGPQVAGELMVDSGAEKALVKHGKSLLPSGIIRVSGDFEEGDLVKIVNENQVELARGFTNYGKEQLDKIIGKKSTEIESILGFNNADEVVHRDNLVVTGN